MELSAFDAFAKLHTPHIHARLDRYTTEQMSEAPEKLREAMRYTLLLPGKRLRPLLTLAAAEACGATAEAAMPAACAMEMIHAFSLIHDDVPAMDDDDVRRGQPANHIVYGENVALLAGDALLALAFEVLARELSEHSAHRCILHLAHAVGACGMCGGQYEDVQRDSQDVLAVSAKKTGSLFEAAARLGGFIAEASKENIDALGSFGLQLGIAFQIADDIIDGEGGDPSAVRRMLGDAVSFLNVLGARADVLRGMAARVRLAMA